MAAGSNIYANKKLTVQRDGVNNDVFYAKELDEYISLSNLKQIFYLDYVFQTGVDGENVFIGGVKENSENYYFHKSTRLSMLGMLSGVDKQEYILCNDGGLNTFAYMIMILGRYKFANYMEFSILVRSAYYDATQDYGFYYKVDNGELLKKTFNNTIPQKDVFNDPTFIIEYLAFYKNQKVEITPFTINAEGEKKGDTITFYTDDFIYRQLATKIPNLYTNPNIEGTISNFFLTYESLKNMGRVTHESGLYNIMVYVDPPMTVPIDDGLYYITYSPLEGEIYQGDELGAYNGNKAVVQISKGRVQKWDIGLWSTPDVKDIYVGVVAEMVNPPLDTYTYRYIITIRNTTPNPSGDLLIDVYSYTMANGSFNLEPFRNLGSRTINCPPNSQVTYESDKNIFLSDGEIAIGLRGDLPSNIQISGPSLVPGKNPLPDIKSLKI